MSYDYLFKYIFVGETGAGKTSFADRLVNSEFHYHHETTIGVDFRCKMNTLHDNVVIKSHIWDTAGQEKFSSIITSYYKGIAGAIIVYDVGKRQSFRRVDFWRKELERNRHSPNDPMVILLVANKTDKMSRVISEEEGKQYAMDHGLLFAEVSCKENKNVEQAYEWLIMETYERMNKENPGCGIKRSIAFEEDEMNISQNGKGSDCPRNCCVIV